MTETLENLAPWLMGHESAFKNGSLSHGYLISGEKGIGKLRFIERLSQSILCTESNELFTFCGKCNSCRTFESKSSPDFFLVQENPLYHYAMVQYKSQMNHSFYQTD